jgi:hypothetical protein
VPTTGLGTLTVLLSAVRGRRVRSYSVGRSIQTARVGKPRALLVRAEGHKSACAQEPGRRPEQRTAVTRLTA